MTPELWFETWLVGGLLPAIVAFMAVDSEKITLTEAFAFSVFWPVTVPILTITLLGVGVVRLFLRLAEYILPSDE